MKVNYRDISKKIEADLSPTIRKSLALVSKKTAHWGIKDEGNLALIMGVLNFGDPDHRVPNTPQGRPAPIPKRPWLNRSTERIFQARINNYIEKNLGKLLAGLKKRGKAGSGSSQRALSAEDFLKGLAEVGRDNARQIWEKGNFAPNTDATLRNKRGDKPLHDKGRMNQAAITGWVD